jgi:hypothetical protein
MPATPRKPNRATDQLAEQSVAGEEDPGAALDGDDTATRAPRPATRPASAPAGGPPLAPGDEAAAGTPGTGEAVCDRCGGSGKTEAGSRCPPCGGSGKVIRGIGGA